MQGKDELHTLIASECIDRNFTRNVYEPGERRQHSGRWLFDFKKIILDPPKSELLIDKLWREIEGRDNIQIGGLESASIPIVTALVLRAHREGKKVSGFYIRKSRNKKNLNKHIEGNLNDDPVILVDDLMNTSGSFKRQIEVLEQLGKRVVTVLTIVCFRDPAEYTYLQERCIEIRYLYTLAEFDLNFGDPSLPPEDPYKKRLLFSPEIASYSVVAPKSTPALCGDLILFGTDHGYFYALNKDDGSVQWKLAMGRHAETKSIHSAPAVANGIVFFGSYDGSFYAVDAASGAIQWTFCDCEWIGSSPAVSEELGLVFVGLEHGLPGRRGSVVALDLESGEKKWEHVSPALTHASPLYLPKTQQVCIGGNEGVLRMFNAQTGELQWQFETEGGSTYTGDNGSSEGDIKLAPAFDEETDSIAVSSMDGWLYVLERKSGAMHFRVHTDYLHTTRRAGIYGSPLFMSEHILFGALDKSVYCVDKKSGDFIWRRGTAGRVFATPMVIDERVFIGSNDGRLYEFDLSSGKRLSTTQFPERITNRVVYDAQTRTMYVITQTNDLYKLTLP